MTNDMKGFVLAEKMQLPLFVAFTGASNAGKTFSSLRTAHELRKRIDPQRIVCVIDTEGGKSALYAGHKDLLGTFYVKTLTPPYSPDKVVQALKEAEALNPAVIIIDSLSAAWAGSGGVLAMVDRAQNNKRNKFTAWAEPSAAHESMMEALQSCPFHLLVTMRSKMAYEQYEEGGRKKVRRIGLEPVQRNNVVYSFDVVIDMVDEGTPIGYVVKTRCSTLYGTHYEKPGPVLAGIMHEWATNGAENSTEAIDNAKAAWVAHARQVGLVDKDTAVNAATMKPLIQVLGDLYSNINGIISIAEVEETQAEGIAAIDAWASAHFEDPAPAPVVEQPTLLDN